MSDVNSVAEAMGIPAELVRRSADARATANGISADEILTAWGGGASVAAPPAASTPVEPSAEEPSSEPVSETGDVAPPPPTAPILAEAPAPDAAVLPTQAPVSGAPPVLVGAKDNPWAVLAGAVGLFLAVVLLGLVGPAIPVDSPGARSGAIPFSAAAETGRDLYGSLGCAACHTQMIRPIIADVGLGPVTLNDTAQVLGTRRFGPDLAEVGSRLSELQLQAVIERSATHPTYQLSAEDMSDLVSYLLESTTTGASGG